MSVPLFCADCYTLPITFLPFVSVFICSCTGHPAHSLWPLNVLSSDGSLLFTLMDTAQALHTFVSTHSNAAQAPEKFLAALAVLGAA